MPCLTPALFFFVCFLHIFIFLSDPSFVLFLCVFCMFLFFFSKPIRLETGPFLCIASIFYALDMDTDTGFDPLPWLGFLPDLPVHNFWTWTCIYNFPFFSLSVHILISFTFFLGVFQIIMTLLFSPFLFVTFSI